MTNTPNLQLFQSAYGGEPPWNLGRPQPTIIQVADQIVGSVLDAGCGTGDNALFFAQRGQPVLGIDFVEVAIARAKRKAEEQSLNAEFLVWDALKLPSLGRHFDSVIDCGLFHVLTDADRLVYVEGLAQVMKEGGKVILMCFSDAEPGDWGPRRIRQDEIREAFANGWTVESITATHFEVNPNAKEKFEDDGPRAWLAVIRRGS